MIPLLVATAFDPDRNLGRAYNNVLAAVEEAMGKGWVCFVDHDAIWTTRTWYSQLVTAIEANPDAGMITAVTNRIGNKRQIAPNAPKGHDMAEHRKFGEHLAAVHKSTVVDVTEGAPISGVVMAVRVAPDRPRFRDGFFGVDNCMHWDLRDAGYKVYQMPGLYVYHWYRGDGVGHPQAPKAHR